MGAERNFEADIDRMRDALSALDDDEAQELVNDLLHLQATAVPTRGAETGGASRHHVFAALISAAVTHLSQRAASATLEIDGRPSGQHS